MTVNALFLMQDSPAINDTPGEIDFNPGMLIQKLDSWLDGFVRLIPNLAIAIILVIVAYFITKAIGSFIQKRAMRRDRRDLGTMLGGIVRWTLFLLAALFALTLIAPTLNPGDLIAGLGVSSVAIGFAFKDILQNWLAGLLILLRQPFEVGDQIEASGYEGTVERIETRSTIIKTYDGQRAVIPNSEIYTDAVLVKTAHKMRRSQYDIGIGYGDDMPGAMALLQDMLTGIDDVVADPAPEVLVWDMAASWVTLRLRWWTDSHRSDVVHVRSKVLMGLKDTLDSAGVDMPYETVVNLFHDQTEEFDGIPSKQREGWTARPNEKTRALWQVIDSGEDGGSLEVGDKPKAAAKDS
ncbi:MAG: mechanosensitive ion channel family protein [Litorimonas sp.]